MLIHFAMLAALAGSASGSASTQFVCTWTSPDTSPPDSYTLYQLELGAYRFDNAPAKLTRLENTAAEGAVISGVGPAFTVAPPLGAAIAGASMTQTFYDEEVTYIRTYFVEHRRDTDGGVCKANEDLKQCRYGVKQEVMLDPCGSASPLIVLFPTGLNPRCFLKTNNPPSPPAENRALPWETSGAAAFINGWSREKELAQRSRCGNR
ncbi:MAG: hypothetical protein ACXWR4_21455 [Bdellovibrionota bacterium]